MADDLTDMITAADAAETLGVDVRTVNRWAQTGLLRAAIKLPGARGARLFRRDDVERLARRRSSRTSPAA